jgi:hypothetical protein
MVRSSSLGLLCSATAVAAWTPSSFTPRMSSSARVQAQSWTRAPMVMEDFGFLKGTKFGFEEIWGGNPVISERGVEAKLNDAGLRYRMWRTPEEGGGPQSIWEAIGFTATSNNAARQREKMAASKNAKGGDEVGQKRTAWLEKYGYPRLVGTKGIFYADQLSSDSEPMGGFGMGKSGVMFPVPEVVESGTYGGSKGWGMKMGANAKKTGGRPQASAAPSSGGGFSVPSVSLPSVSLPSFSFGGGDKKAAAPARKAAPAKKAGKAEAAPKFLTKPLGSGK